MEIEVQKNELTMMKKKVKAKKKKDYCVDHPSNDYV